MGEGSKIQWTDETFNFGRGCTKVSAGCTHCYAEQLSLRNPKVLGVWGDKGTRVVASEAMWREPLKWAEKWRKAGGRRGRVFCASLADWLEDRPEWKEPRERLMDLIAETGDALEWLLLTKRPENGVRLLAQGRHGAVCSIAMLRHRGARLGVSVESQEHTKRITDLLKWWDGPNFVSAEPLLGPLDLPPVDWVIVGGESGAGARPCAVDWIAKIIAQCKRAGSACFVKQLGARPVIWDHGCGDEFTPDAPGWSQYGRRDGTPLRDRKGGDPEEWESDLRVREWPKAPRPNPDSMKETLTL